MAKKTFDIIVIGGGPGGYVAAIRAVQRGASVALVEAGKMGGTCLNVGCIPTKALIADSEVYETIKNAEHHGISVGQIGIDFAKMTNRKDGVVDRIRTSLNGLIQSKGITISRGFGKLTGPHQVKVIGGESALLSAEKIIVATGSEPRDMMQFPFDGKLIHSSTTILDLKKLPKSLVIVGGGVIGCEAASLYHSLGVKVTIVEMLPIIISPEGEEIAKILRASLEKRGITIHTEVMVEGIDKKKTSVSVRLKDREPINADMALVAVGRKLNTDNIGLEKAGIVVERDVVPVNNRMETNIPHIYAIGDITAKWLLAHCASHQGIVAADNATGHEAEMHYNAVPSVIFTHPEIGTVGMTLEKAKAAGYDAARGRFPFAALGKSIAIAEEEGFAQVIIDRKTGQILGAQVVGQEAATLIAQMTQAIANELTIESIEETIHAHPTLSEGWLEATLKAAGRPIHLP